MNILKKSKEEESENELLNMNGWECIEKAFSDVYPNQDNPKHYGTLIPFILGGNDPIDGVSVYDGGDYWHFVTFGLTELYEKETDNPEYSGYGMEFTLKLKKDCYDTENEENEIKCIIGILQQIAKITFNSGELFQENEYIYTGQKQGIDFYQKSLLTGFITVADSKIKSINTPNGKVNFIEFIGVTDDELIMIKNKNMTVQEFYKILGSDVTDYRRKSVF
ncbi:MAG: suppressor of fused domain protein [Ruminococcus sp.]|nr:suppressor of fused domain protein [Ruminococcus sp.]